MVVVVLEELDVVESLVVVGVSDSEDDVEVAEVTASEEAEVGSETAVDESPPDESPVRLSIGSRFSSI